MVKKNVGVGPFEGRLDMSGAPQSLDATRSAAWVYLAACRKRSCLTRLLSSMVVVVLLCWFLGSYYIAQFRYVPSVPEVVPQEPRLFSATVWENIAGILRLLFSEELGLEPCSRVQTLGLFIYIGPQSRHYLHIWSPSESTSPKKQPADVLVSVQLAG